MDPDVSRQSVETPIANTKGEQDGSSTHPTDSYSSDKIESGAQPIPEDPHIDSESVTGPIDNSFERHAELGFSTGEETEESGSCAQPTTDDRYLVYESGQQQTAGSSSEHSVVHPADIELPVGTSSDEVEFVSLQPLNTQEIVVGPLEST